MNFLYSVTLIAICLSWTLNGFLPISDFYHFMHWSSKNTALLNSITLLFPIYIQNSSRLFVLPLTLWESFKYWKTESHDSGHQVFQTPSVHFGLACYHWKQVFSVVSRSNKLTDLCSVPKSEWLEFASSFKEKWWPLAKQLNQPSGPVFAQCISWDSVTPPNAALCTLPPCPVDSYTVWLGSGFNLIFVTSSRAS